MRSAGRNELQGKKKEKYDQRDSSFVALSTTKEEKKGKKDRRDALVLSVLHSLRRKKEIREKGRACSAFQPLPSGRRVPDGRKKEGRKRESHQLWGGKRKEHAKEGGESMHVVS